MLSAIQDCQGRIYKRINKKTLDLRGLQASHLGVSILGGSPTSASQLVYQGAVASLYMLNSEVKYPRKKTKLKK